MRMCCYMKEKERMRQCEKEEKFHFRIDELFYYLFIVIVMGAKGIGLSEGQKLFTCCLLLAGLCWVVKMCLTGYSVKEWILTILLLGLGFVIWRRTGEKAAVAAFMVILGMKKVPLKRLMKVCLAVWGITFLFSLSRGLLGLYDGVVVVHEKLGLGPIIRYSLGYTHPNVLHVTYFIIMLLLLYVFQPKGKRLYLTAALLFIGNLYIFLYSISYTGMVIVTAYLLLLLYFDFRGKISLPEKGLAMLFFLFCVAFPIAGPFLLTGKAFNFFNNLLSTRFELVYNLFSENQVSLFGTYIVPSTEASLTLDSSFAYMLMYYGIVAFVPLVGLYFYSLYYYLAKDRLQDAAILLGIALAGVTEQFLFNLSFKNLALFLLGHALFDGILRPRKEQCSREWGILLSLSREGVSFSARRLLPRFRDAGKRVWREKRKGLILCSIAGAVLMAVGWLAVGVKPEYVLVERRGTDYRGDDEFVMTAELLADESPHIRVGSVSEGCSGYMFRGNAIRLEWVRHVISAFVWGFLDGGMVAMAILVWQDGRTGLKQ